MSFFLLVKGVVASLATVVTGQDGAGWAYSIALAGVLIKHNERARVAPQDSFKDALRAQKKNATRTPRARPLAWCLVFGSLTRSDRYFMGSLAPFALILVLAL